MSSTTTRTEGLVFISCGQVSEEERRLGDDVERLVRELTPYEPWFAKNVSSLDGLTRNILGALNRSVGLIAIMHPRGAFTVPAKETRVRASVWIEQEIAIAAFMTQVLHSPLKVVAFVHADIYREEMRDQLQLNPIPFRDDAEVRDKLRELLPTWRGLRLIHEMAASVKLWAVLRHCQGRFITIAFHHDSDQIVLITSIEVKSNDIHLMKPGRPGPEMRWEVHPGQEKAIQLEDEPGPAARLVQRKPNPGITFQTEMEVLWEYEVLGQKTSDHQKFAVRVNVSDPTVKQL